MVVIVVINNVKASMSALPPGEMRDKLSVHLFERPGAEIGECLRSGFAGLTERRLSSAVEDVGVVERGYDEKEKLQKLRVPASVLAAVWQP